MEKIGNFRIEPRSIFKGRGKHPKSGLTKDSVMPEDVTINIGKRSQIPICPIPGRNWQSVVHKKDAYWIASWPEPIQNGRKYVGFAGNSKVKTVSDLKKYEKARELKKCIGSIRSHYKAMMESNSLHEK